MVTLTLEFKISSVSINQYRKNRLLDIAFSSVNLLIEFASLDLPHTMYFFLLAEQMKQKWISRGNSKHGNDVGNVFFQVAN